MFRRRAGAGFTLVPALLAEMDGNDDSGAFVMLATNRPDSLDAAITRPGRIDRKIRITRPDLDSTARIFAIHLDGVFLDEPVLELASAAATEMFRDEHKLYDLDLDGEPATFLLRDLSSER